MLKQLYIHDNIHVLRGINSNSIDLIATDPPFNAKRVFNSISDNRKTKKVFDDRWRWDEVTAEWTELLSTSHRDIVELIEAAVVIEGGTVKRRTGEISTGRIKNSIAAFLCWMAPRLIEMERVLKPTGSIYLHCDDAANSYLRLLMDCVFGRENYRNTITWERMSGAKPSNSNFGRNSDTILFYVKSKKAIFNSQYLAPVESTLKTYKHDDNDGKGKYRLENISAPGGNGYRYDLGLGEKSPSGGYRMPPSTATEWLKSGRLVIRPGKVPTQKRYLSDYKGTPIGNIWTDIECLRGKERTGFPTQKPVALYERIIKASSNPDPGNTTILDPFCGCSTTLIAAENLNRQWIGIDVDSAAKEILQQRMGNIKFKSSTRAPKRNDIEIIPDTQLRILLHRKQMKKCANQYCTSKEIRPEDLELDHILPRSRGGDDGISNRIGLCSNCNKRKSAKSVGEFIMSEAKEYEKREKYLRD